MNQKKLSSLKFEVGLAIALALVCVLLRVGLTHIPNFAPITGIAIFAGYFFKRSWIAIAIPAASMLISDAFIGGYSFSLMLSVYGCLLFPVLLGVKFVRPSLERNHKSTLRRMLCRLSIPASAFVAAVNFFVVTNFMVWLQSGFYARSLEGLSLCYTAAIPFFKYTFAGDLTFAIVSFLIYESCLAVARTFQSDSQVEVSTERLS